MRRDDRSKGLRSHVGNVEGFGSAVAFNEGDDCFLGRGFAMGAVLFAAADKGFVGFDDLAFAAEPASRDGFAGHRFADAMRQKPRRPVRADAKVAHKFKSRDAVLVRRHQVNCEKPFVQRDMRALHYRTGSAGELVAAIVAEEITVLRLPSHAMHVH